jgi:pantothenate kinase
MDGFHLDNTLLRSRGLLSRKGAPETFDVAGLKHLVQRLRDEGEVIFPVFDRATERAVAGAGLVTDATQTVVVEGNYLLLDAPEWRDFATLWDFSVFLKVPEPELRARLMARWNGFGYSDAQAAEKTDGNDMENARTVMTQVLPADLVIENF